jgi:hypothetical protein
MLLSCTKGLTMYSSILCLINQPGSYSFDRLICENQRHTLRCYGGRKIKITHAMYGRDNMLKCGFFPWAFCSSQQTAKVDFLLMRVGCL